MSDNKIIEITPKNLLERFKIYNKKYFDDLLPKPKKFIIGDYDFIAGTFCRNEKGNKHEIKGNIWVSNKFNFTEEFLEYTLVHEMVHMYVQMKLGRKPFFEHPRSFKRKIKELNETYGLELDVKCPKEKYFKYKKPQD